jgi:hypothetical protein
VKGIDSAREAVQNTDNPIRRKTTPIMNKIPDYNSVFQSITIHTKAKLLAGRAGF